MGYVAILTNAWLNFLFGRKNFQSDFRLDIDKVEEILSSEISFLMFPSIILIYKINRTDVGFSERRFLTVMWKLATKMCQKIREFRCK